MPFPGLFTGRKTLGLAGPDRINAGNGSLALLHQIRPRNILLLLLYSRSARPGQTRQRARITGAYLVRFKD